MSMCYCGSEKPFKQCCEPFIKGSAKPETAQQLMRSRYTAFATGAVDYIHKSILPSKRSDFDEKATREWSANSQWHGFEIKSAEKGGPEDTTGTVEFIATYSTDDTTHNHHEIAEFKKQNGRWYFVDGTLQSQKPYVRPEPRIGRNDPCSCGSGKKYKKCCALKSD